MAPQLSNKSASTNDKYQSTFMPIFTDAEARIKRLVVFAFFTGMSKTALRFQIAQVIMSLKKQIPADLHDRDAYIKGITASSERLIKEYEKTTRHFNSFIKKAEFDIPIKNPKQFQELAKKKGSTLLAKAKGSVQIEWYDKELKKFINNVGETAMTTREEGKKPISLWQKAELDVRYQHNMDMIKEQVESGVQYAYLSSHADCSKRCEKWQGKLVSLTEHATMSGMRVKKLDGKWVYSLPDIMAQKDKYGYNNNIISGFNCRHYTIPYKEGSGQSAPKEYSEKDVKKQRAIETKIRTMEREIRAMKMKLNEYNSIDDKKAIAKLKKQIRIATEKYKNFCTSHGYAWYDYRIKVNDNNVYLINKENK